MFMNDGVVSNVPAWLLLLGLIVLIAGGAVLVQLYVRHRFPQLTKGAHNNVTQFAFGVIALVYAFFIGFVVNAMWGKVNDADALVTTEGAAGVQLAKTLTVFDKADSDRIRQSLMEYERAADSEWSTAARGRSVPEVDDALHRLYTAYEEVQPRTDAQRMFLRRSITDLDKLSQARTERILNAGTNDGPPWPLWAVILLASGLVVGCAIIYGVERPAMHYTMVATVGVLVAAQLFLVLELAHPFIGPVSATPNPPQVIQVLSRPPA
jgi:hypothetical protein